MARYKPVDRHLSKMLPVKFSEQIIPGTFEYALNWLVDHQIDMSVFDARYRNDETGASAYDPAVLLKIVLLGYARGLTSSRNIERACRENVVFMALSGDTQPRFTTIASFVARMPQVSLPSKAASSSCTRLKEWCVMCFAPAICGRCRAMWGWARCVTPQRAMHTAKKKHSLFTSTPHSVS